MRIVVMLLVALAAAPNPPTGNAQGRSSLGVGTPDPLAEAKQRLARGNYAEARDQFAKHATPAAAIGVAKAWRAEGESAKALIALEDALKTHAANPDLLAHRGDLFYSLGKWDDAAKDAEAVIAKDGKHFLARWVRVRVLRDKGDTAAADKEMRWFVREYTDASNAEKDITDPETLLIVGQAGAENATWNNRPQQFSFILNEVYKDAIKFDADLWQAENLAGRMLLEKHNRADALEAFDKALKINPKATEAIIGKGLVALQKFELKDAEQFAESALKINPKHPEALRLKADVLILGGDFATAERLLTAARAVNPRDPGTLARIAACYHFLRKPDLFAGILKEAESYDTKPGAFYHDLAAAFEDRKAYTKAGEFYRTAANLRPMLPGPRAGLGMLLLRKGDEGEARQLLDAAFKVDPFNVKVSNSLRVLKHLDTYATLETPHYTLKYDPKTDAILAAFLADHLEEVHAELKRQFGYEPPGKSLIEVFSTHEMFSGRVISLPDLHTIGACSGRLVAMASPAAKGLGRPFNWSRVVRHELTHVFNLTQTDDQVPHWLTEGLAVRNEGGTRPPSWSTLLRDRVAKGDLLDLDNITLAFVRPRTPDEWTLAYAQSHLYVEYVIKTHGEGVVGKLLEAFRGGAGTEAVLKQVLNVEKAAFEKGYRGYVEEVAKAAAGEKRRAEKPMTVAELEAAHAKTPDDTDIMARLASEYVRRNKADEAKKLVDAALAKEKGHALASVVKARMLQRNKDEAGARAVLEEAEKENPNDPRVLLALGKLLIDAKEFDKATVPFEKGRKVAPLDGEWLEELARLYATLDKKAELASVLGEIAAKNPDDLPARLKLARTFTEMEKHADAENAARDALFIDVKHEEARSILIEALKAQSKGEEAQKIAATRSYNHGVAPLTGAFPMSNLSRRDFLKTGAALAVAPAVVAAPRPDALFKISLAQWSLHRAFFGKKADPLNFAKIAKDDYGIAAVEYVNQFYKEKKTDGAYLSDLKKVATDNGVTSVLIMCDGEGALGDADTKKRAQAVENHKRWVEWAKFLGCHSIRVNAQSSGSYDEQIDRAADGLRKLTEFGDTMKIGVIVENHGGLSSNGAWLAAVMKKVDNKNCGTLPDFGNFRISAKEEYDRYKGVDELMPFAKGVSAKTHDFDDKGNETHTDYRKMMDIVCKKHKYSGFVGIEYEGGKLSEPDGIKATKKLLEVVMAEMTK